MVASGFFFSNIDFFFTKNKREKKKMRLPNWSHYRPSATPETDFCLGWPHITLLIPNLDLAVSQNV